MDNRTVHTALFVYHNDRYGELNAFQCQAKDSDDAEIQLLQAEGTAIHVLWVSPGFESDVIYEYDSDCRDYLESSQRLTY